MIKNTDTDIYRDSILEEDVRRICIILYLEDGYTCTNMPISKITITLSYYSNDSIYTIRFFDNGGVVKGDFRDENETLLEVISSVINSVKNNND